MADAPVALVSQESNLFGGGEQSLLVLLRGLMQRGVPARLVCPEPGELAFSAQQLGAEVVFSPMPRLRGLSGWRAGKAVKKLRKAVAGTRLVHLNGTRPMLVARLARLSQPLVWHVRQTAREPLLDRFLGAHATRIVAISEAVRERFLPLSCAAKVRVVPNGVCLETFHPLDRDSLCRELDLPVDMPIVVAPGRLHSTKGFVHLIDAMAHCPDAMLLLVGDGPERKLLEQRARPLGNRVRFVGERRDIPTWLNLADVVAVPSMVEPFGRVAIEAMACAKPVVASCVGGLPEIVVSQQTGLLVIPGDVSNLGEALASLIRDPQRARAMGAAGRARAESLYSLGAHAERVLAVYRECDPSGWNPQPTLAGGTQLSCASP